MPLKEEEMHDVGFCKIICNEKKEHKETPKKKTN